MNRFVFCIYEDFDDIVFTEEDMQALEEPTHLEFLEVPIDLNSSIEQCIHLDVKGMTNEGVVRAILNFYSILQQKGDHGLLGNRIFFNGIYGNYLRLGTIHNLHIL